MRQSRTTVVPPAPQQGNRQPNSQRIWPTFAVEQREPNSQARSSVSSPNNWRSLRTARR